MRDDPSIYINASTPGFTTAQIYPAGDEFDIIFDEPFGDESFQPTFVCAESDASGLQSRDTQLTIRETQYLVVGKPFLDGMGLATVTLQEG